MGGFFGAVSKRDIVLDTFFGVDYHSHLGTKFGGMTIYHPEKGFQRQIHNITNTPFRTRFEPDIADMKGNCGIGCISDDDPQPLLLRSHLGLFAITTVGIINNADDLIVARDKLGRLPVLIGKDENGYCVSFESFVYHKLGYEDHYELGPQEIVKITPEGIEVLSPAAEKMRLCAFLWTYYGYPNSNYEGKNVEVMRYRNGEIMARNAMADGTAPDVDYVAGVPDSGLPHGIGYANESGKKFARPFIKYTPTWSRSFMPANQQIRNQVAKMKQIPVPELIKDKKLLLIDDSIVRGTQLRETVDFLYKSGAKEVHMRSACPPIMYSCKYLNFSRGNSDMELLARRVIQELEGDEGHKHLAEYADAKTERGQCMLKSICDKMGFDSLGFQSVEGLIEAIGLDPEKLCTYCWTGKE